ncbi:MAG TPA: N-acetyltransferase [Actinomycetota bacterium]|nr:N-acetyltransferase [Actinomycetota bacterium]
MTSPEGTIRVEEPRDHAAIADLLADAFEGLDEVRLVERLRAEVPEDYGPALVAELDGAVVGFVALTRVRIGERALFALAPVAVLPAVQNLGIGSALVSHAVGLVTAPVVVLGDPAYYRRFGFEPALAYGVRSAWDASGDAWMIRWPDGADTAAWEGTVRYPDAFSAV